MSSVHQYRGKPECVMTSTFLEQKSECCMTHLVPGLDIIGVVMADDRGGGQGAYMPLMNVTALAAMVAILAPEVFADPKVDVEVVLVGPEPPTPNSNGASL